MKECGVVIAPEARLEVAGSYTKGRWAFHTRLVIWEHEPNAAWHMADDAIEDQPHVCRRPGHYALGWQSGKLALYALKSAYPYTKPYRPALLLTLARGTGRGQREAFLELLGERIRSIVADVHRSIRSQGCAESYCSVQRTIDLKLNPEEWRNVVRHFQPSSENVQCLSTRGVYTVLFHPGMHPACRDH